VETKAIISLGLVDTTMLPDCDTWIESCLHYGTLENCGDQLGPTCDDLAA
jgi:hypothetical protein